MGLSMIEHVRRRVAMSSAVDDVFVATCDDEIRAAVVASGGRVVMTASSHERCTDRVAEAAREVDATIVVNVQGDEPLILPTMIGEVVAPIVGDPEVSCVNLMSKITEQDEFENSNVVKAVVSLSGELLYYSRAPIPSADKSGGYQHVRWKQLGIIAFRSDFLEKFAKLEPTPLEIMESVDMMRAVEHGFPIRMVETETALQGVDEPADVGLVEELLGRDPLLNRYL